MKSASTWKTKFTQSFQCTLPIMGAPMAGVSGGVLAAATTRAGALGFVAAGHADNLQQLDDQIDLYRQHAPKNSPLALGFITHSSCSADFTKLETILQRHKPKYVQFFAPAVCTLQVSPTCQKTNVQIAQEHGAQVLVQVGSIADAKEALAAGVDAIIAQGSESGGHGLRRDLGSGTLSLAARVAKLVALHDEHRRDIPVLVAGGMVNGHSLAAALALGCDGIVLGTRLWASHEAMGRPEHKQLLTTKEADDCLRTTVIDQIQNSYSTTPWPYPYDSVGVLKNTLTDTWDGKPREVLEATIDTVAARYRKAQSDGESAICNVYAGEGVGDISSVESAYDIILDISAEAMEIVRAMPNFLQDQDC